MVLSQQSAVALGDEAVSTSLVILNGFIVFFMQVGFLALETGSGRAKNVRNILLKNLLDVMLAALAWWAVGYAIGYGRSGGGVIGTTHFFYEGESLPDKSIRPWFFSWTFAIAACTIISGCLAERTALTAYPLATLAIAALVHPLLVHWIWNTNGWTTQLHECNVLDFAGGMVVHMVGGLFGLVGAWRCGPRLGRFELVSSAGEDDDDDDGELQLQQLEDAQAAADTVDSASDLLASSSAAGPPPTGELGAPDQQACAAEAAERDVGGSRSLHSLLPSPSATSCSATGVGSSSVEMGQLPGAAKGGTQLGAAVAAAGAEVEAAAAPGGSSRDLEGLKSGAPAGNGFGGSKLWTRLRGQQQAGHRARCIAAASSSSSGRCRGRLLCKYVAKEMPGHDMAFVTLGTFMLWFGFFGFNTGAVYMYVASNPHPTPGSLAGTVSAEVVQRTSMNTALAGSASGLSALLTAALLWGTYNLRICCNGVLSGLVVVTCMCGFVDPWAAVVCAAVAGALYAAASAALLRLGIDDPLDSSVVHLGGGLLGSLMVAFVAKPQHVAALTGSPCGGIFYSSSGWAQLGLQLLGVAITLALAGSTSLLLFWALDAYHLLRVDQVTELAGIDCFEHGGPAYEQQACSRSVAYCGGGGGAAVAAPADGNEGAAAGVTCDAGRGADRGSRVAACPAGVPTQ